MYSESLFNTLSNKEKTKKKIKKIKKNSFGKNKRYKKCTLFSFRELQLALLLILSSYRC